MHKKLFKINKLLIITAACVLALADHTFAQGSASAYPVRPVRFVIPFPPGGSNDIFGRMLAQALTERLGRNVIADNRAGGNSIIGTELVANSPPDGYTLLIISTSFTTNPVIHKLPFDPLKAFDWVAMLGVGPNVLAVTHSLPAKNVKELIAQAEEMHGVLRRVVEHPLGEGAQRPVGALVLLVELEPEPALEERGVTFMGDTLDTGVCHMAFFADPDGNALMLHHRYAPRVTEG